MNHLRHGRVPGQALERSAQDTTGTRFAPYLEAQRLEARQEEVQRQQCKVIVSRLDVGAKVLYAPRPGYGDVLHAGQSCEVVRPGKPGAQHPTVRVRFQDGHELTVRPGLLERSTTAFKARPAPTPMHPVVEALRERASYKVLLHLAAAELQEDADESTRVETRAQALKMVRGHLKAYPQEADLMVLVSELLDLVWREAALRFDRRARRQRTAEPAPERPQSLLSVTAAHLSRLQRQEANLIAAAILEGDVIHHKRPDDDLTPPRGPAAQPSRAGDVGEYEVTYREMHYNAMLCVRYSLSNAPSLAYHHATLADDARLRYETLTAHLAAQRTDHWSGRYHDGDRYRVDLPVNEDQTIGLEDAERREAYTFELVIVWAEDGCSLDVANGVEIEAASGVWVGDEGWTSLCRWLEHHDDRLNRGTQRGRQFEDHGDLIWRVRSEGDGYRLRTNIAESYPGIERALEAVRCLARLENREQFRL
ncbi:hypothetical protein GCM10022631_01910 [Deinococcus rubellus]|uniref:Uncharacterized protein n=1 Tax=Deinococcus rubellus TaxID=1889240 RepID=A0ABY5YI28_9DEIO|nr:hypothetical protein [Deinococcus rubellus]UWX64773.1 hypothetical protein N0D28_03680 [Deinococcus rubellus]